jgi:DNA-binding GntR family transcriptional regulator
MAGDEGAVLDALRAAILRGEFAAGQRLVEVDLCERFGCSRFAVRAAIPVLASEGLVDVQRHRGARVRVMLSLVPGRPAVSLVQHERIVAAIMARNPAEAQTAMQDHISNVIEAFSSLPLARTSTGR